MSNTHDRTRDHRGTQDISTITQGGVPISMPSPLGPIFPPPPAPGSGIDVEAAVGSYDVGTVTLSTEQYLLQYDHLKLAGTGRLTVAGTSEVFLSDFGTNAVFIAGQPKGNTSFTIPNDYLYDLMYRLTLSGSNRATLQGTADLVMTDDFGRRSRIVLA